MVQASNSRGTASRSIDVSGNLRDIMIDLWFFEVYNNGKLTMVMYLDDLVMVMYMLMLMLMPMLM